jgi:hypothetical protein
MVHLFTKLYFGNFLLNPASPINPEVRRRMVEGSLRRVSETMTQTADQLHYTVWG